MSGGGQPHFAEVILSRRAWGKPLASNDISLRTAKVTAIFCALAAAVYAAVQADPSPSLALFFSFGPLLAVILWLQKDMPDELAWHLFWTWGSFFG